MNPRRIAPALALTAAVVWPTTGAAVAAGDEERAPWRLELDVAPTSYAYEESGEGPLFSDLATHWHAFAVRTALEGSYETAIGLAPVLRFAGLTSLRDEERVAGAPNSDLRVQYAFELQPALQFRVRPLPFLELAPEIAWDLDWYRQDRDVPGLGHIDEDVFWQGPALGASARAELGRRCSAELRYRHSFLIGVRARNELAESFGVGDVTTDGHRDVVQLRLGTRVSRHLRLIAGYRFESARIEASDVETVPFGGGTLSFQFPRNEHTLHAGELGVELAF